MRHVYFFLLVISVLLIRPLTEGFADELVLHLSFDELEGKVAKDISPFGNHATFKGNVKQIDGVFGQALELDGKSSGEIPDDPSLDIVDGVTIEFWAIVRGGDAIQSGVEKGRAWISGEYNLAALYNGGTILQMFDLPEACNDDNIGPSIQDGNWHFLAGTWDGKTIKLYIDGELEAEMPCKGELSPNDDPLFIGSRGGGGRFLNGALDEIKMYNYALSEQKILDDMGEPQPPQAVDAEEKLAVTWGRVKSKF